MNKQPESNIAVSFLNIHNIITRGLTVSIENVRDLKGGASQEGLFNYIQALVAIVNSHHLTEDEIAFPYFRDMLPGVPYDSLIGEHQVMVQILEEIKLALEKADKNDQPETKLRDLESALTRLNEIWHPHIRIETDEFITKADGLIPVEEQLRLVRLFGEAGMKYAVPPYLTVPFMLYNLPLEDRLVFSMGMPAEVTQNLVPVVWKEKWESMTPFFLA